MNALRLYFLMQFILNNVLGLEVRGFIYNFLVIFSMKVFNLSICQKTTLSKIPQCKNPLDSYMTACALI